MYRVTTTAGLDQQSSNAPDVADALDAHLREQLIDAEQPVHINWTITRPTGEPLRGWASTPGGDPGIEANLDALHRSIATDFAFELYEASRLSGPDATISA